MGGPVLRLPVQSGLTPHCRQGLPIVHPSLGPSRAVHFTLQVQQGLHSQWKGNMSSWGLGDTVTKPRDSRSHLNMRARECFLCSPLGSQVVPVPVISLPASPSPRPPALLSCTPHRPSVLGVPAILCLCGSWACSTSARYENPSHHSPYTLTSGHPGAPCAL